METQTGIPKTERKAMLRQAINLAWPSAIEGALLSIISSVDTMMVKTVGPNAIASVSLTAQPRLILLIIAQALCVGTTALVARRKGEGDQASANSVLAQSMALITVLGVIISLVGVFFAEPIMDLAGADADTREYSVAYFRIIAAGLCFNCWNLCICAALRAVGNTRITMVTNITANLVNVFLNYCLIGGNLGFPKLGVEGAAIATVVGTGVACAISFGVIMHRGGFLYWRPGIPKFDRKTLSGLARVGISSMAESAFLRIGFFLNTKLVAGVDYLALTGYTIVQQVTGLSFTLGDGGATAGATLVGQSLGARNKERAKGYVALCRVMSLVISIGLMILIFFLRDQLGALFTDDPGVIAGASAAFLVVIVAMISQNARVVYSGCLRGAGDVTYVAVCSLVSVAILRPALTWVFLYVLNDRFPEAMFPYTGPWIAFAIDAVVRQLMLFFRVKKGKYLDVKL